MPEYRNPLQEILSAVPGDIEYDDVAEWWENSEWNNSTFPPSAWHNYCVANGIGIEELRRNATRIERGVEELHSAGDNRTCECEWAEHESSCKEG